MIIAVDFDGTCVTHEYPRMGKDIGAVPVLKELVKNGHQLVLFTMRSDMEPTARRQGEEPNLEIRNYLTDAIDWFRQHEIPLYGIQTNPTQHTWTTSPKAYAQLYIDDAALGCPLLYENMNDGDSSLSQGGRPYVNWVKVKEMLVDKGIINIED